MFVDANVFIYAVINSGPKGDQCRAVTRLIEAGQLGAQTSPLVIDEVCWSVRKHTDPETAIEVWDRLLRIPNLRILAIDDRVAMRVPELMRTYRLKPRDALHVATMLQYQLDTVLSDDPDFDTVREITRIKIEDIGSGTGS